MTVAKLKEMLTAFPDDMEIVTRGQGSGARIANSAKQWNAGENPSGFIFENPLILTEMPNGTWFGKDTIKIIVLH